MVGRWDTGRLRRWYLGFFLGPWVGLSSRPDPVRRGDLWRHVRDSLCVETRCEYQFCGLEVHGSREGVTE